MGMIVMLEMDILMKVVSRRSRVRCSVVQEFFAFDAKMKLSVEGVVQWKSPHA